MTEIGRIIPVTLKVKSCRECPHVSNNVQEHNDSFTSTPLLRWWYCNQGENTRETVNITDEYIISKDCPYLRSCK